MRTPHLAAMALLLALAASGCGDDEPSAEPTPKMLSPTSSSTAPPTAEPEPWEVQSRAGVKAFLQRYVEIANKALTSGDTSAYRSLSTNCDQCDDYARQIEDVYGAGGRIESKPDQFVSSSVDQNGVEGGANCIVVFRASPTTWVRKADAEPEDYSGGEIEQVVSLRWTGDSWTIVGVFEQQQ